MTATATPCNALDLRADSQPSSRRRLARTELGVGQIAAIAHGDQPALLGGLVEVGVVGGRADDRLVLGDLDMLAALGVGQHHQPGRLARQHLLPSRNADFTAAS